MIKKPVYVFDTHLSTGIDVVPVDNMILIKDMDGAGTPKLIYLSDKTSITNATTIDDLIDLAGQWYEIGGAGGAGGSIKRQDFVATDLQTDFPCSNTLSTPAVYIEGLLQDADQYEVVSNSMVRFFTPLTAGTEVSIITSVPTANDLVVSHKEVATAGLTIVNTSFELLGEAIYINGILQDGNYDLSPNTVTFHEPLDEGDVVKIYSSAPVVTGAISSFTEVNYDVQPGDTVFNASYTPGSIQVFVNGIKLRNTIDYTATNGTSVTIPLAVENDWVQIVVYTV